MRKGKMANVIHSFESLSLKSRIALVFALSTFAPLLFSMIFSYLSMSNILTNKLHDTLNNNLHQIRLSLENKIDDLNYVSQQIVFSEDINFKLNLYLELEESYERLKNYNDIKKELNLITFSNPSIELSLLYNEDESKYMFNSEGVKEDFKLRNQPLLIKGYKLDNFGPHVSMKRYTNNYVLSTVGKFDVNPNDNIYLYLESNLDLTDGLFQLPMDSVNQIHYLILDDKRGITYSDNSQFPTHTKLTAGDQKGIASVDGHYWFEEMTERGWSIVALIPISQYNKEVNQWIAERVYISMLFVLISSIVGLLLWRTFYIPLNQFNNEIKLRRNNNFHSIVVKTNIPEFVDLIKQFRKMKRQIVHLIKEIERKEKKRADLEVEKLVHQINPHFLMNTLDTARWLAVLGDKKELKHLLTSLNKLLYYNMGKLGELSTLEEELNSLKQYLQLQQIRYDFKYVIDNQIPVELLQTSVPRFILQPLVENYIYHGMVDDGEIHIKVHYDLDRITLKVCDNGRGITKENIHNLLNETSIDHKKNGMGIGLNYVKRILEHTYDDRASIEIRSKLERGTSVIIKIPIIR